MRLALQSTVRYRAAAIVGDDSCLAPQPEAVRANTQARRSQCAGRQRAICQGPFNRDEQEENSAGNLTRFHVFHESKCKRTGFRSVQLRYAAAPITHKAALALHTQVGAVGFAYAASVCASVTPRPYSQIAAHWCSGDDTLRHESL